MVVESVASRKNGVFVQKTMIGKTHLPALAAACIASACCGVEVSCADDVADCQSKAFSVFCDAARRALSDAGELKASKAYTMVSENERIALDVALDWCRRALRDQTAVFPPAPSGNNDILSRGSLPPSSAINVLDDEWRVRAPDGIHSGDLVFSRENGMFALTFWGASTRERRFTHVGIVIKDGETPVIMTADGNPKGATCVSWREFFIDALDGAVYRHASLGAEVARVAKGMEGKPFDPAFDLKTKDRLYCTEMVRDCVNEAAGREVIGTSRKGDFEYVAVDDCYRNEMTKVWDCRDVKPVAETPARKQTEKQIMPKPSPMPALVEAASTTNAPVRRIIRFIPKNGGRR